MKTSSNSSSLLAKISLVLCVVCCVSLYFILKNKRHSSVVPGVAEDVGPSVDRVSVSFTDLLTDLGSDEDVFVSKYNRKQVDILGGTVKMVEDDEDGVVVVTFEGLPKGRQSFFKAHMTTGSSAVIRSSGIKSGSLVDISCEEVDFVDGIGDNCDVLVKGY